MPVSSPPAGAEVLGAVAMPPTSTVQLRLLGAFELCYGGERVELPQSAQRLVAFLALHARPLQRAYVAGSLWLDTTDQRASANLRSTLWRLRKPGFTTVESTITHLRLGSQVDVDLAGCSALARRLIERSDDVADDALRGTVLTMLASDLLPDWLDDDFVLVEQERWRQLRIHALEALSGRLAGLRRFGEAVDAALAAIAAEPLRESAHRGLVAAHLAEGNPSEARRAYTRFRELLDKELGLPPSETMERLVRWGRPAGDGPLTHR